MQYALISSEIFFVSSEIFFTTSASSETPTSSLIAGIALEYASKDDTQALAGGTERPLWTVVQADGSKVI